MPIAGYAVAMQLNQANGEKTASALALEVEDALRNASDKLLPFGKQLLDEIHRRSVPTTKAAGDWQIVETPNFRLMHPGQKQLAAEIAQIAESARRAMYERWAGQPAGNWSPRCDIYLHSSAADYARATSKSADQLGHSTVDQSGRPANAHRRSQR
jgi:hypothetical protein